MAGLGVAGDVLWAEASEEGACSRLLLRLSPRVSVPLLAVAERPTVVIVATRGGALPPARFRPRLGPLYGRETFHERLLDDDYEELVGEDGEVIEVPVDYIRASPAILANCSVVEEQHFLDEYPGFWPAPPDLADRAAGTLAEYDARHAAPGEPPGAAGGVAAAAAPPVPAAAPPRRHVALAAPPAADVGAAAEPQQEQPQHQQLDPAFVRELLQLQQAMRGADPGAPPGVPPLPPPPLPPGLGGRAKAAGAPSASGGPAGGAAATGAGLDQAVVASARAAGIPEEDLATFSRVLATTSRRTPEPQPRRPAAARPEGPEDTVEIDPIAPDEQQPDRLERLIDILNAAFLGRARATAGQGAADSLESAFAALDGPRGWDTGGARRGAAVRLALRRALAEQPEHFSQCVDRQLATAFSSRVAAGQQPTMREYLEFRSRVGAHRPTVSWLWGLAGARDALHAGRTAEALARLDLLMVAGEQVSIDGGSWLLAQELLWEDDPPFHSFSGSRPADPSRAAHSHLCDPRWAEAALARLRELDDWNERRRRLGMRPPPGGPGAGGAGQNGGGIADDGGQAKPKGFPKRPAAKPKAEAPPPP